MRAQASLEILLSFLLFIGVISLFTSIILDFSDKEKQKSTDIYRLNSLQELATTIEVIRNSGTIIVMESTINHKIQENLLVMVYNGSALSTKGVFNVSIKKIQPV